MLKNKKTFSILGSSSFCSLKTIILLHDPRLANTSLPHSGSKEGRNLWNILILFSGSSLLNPTSLGEFNGATLNMVNVVSMLN